MRFRFLHAADLHLGATSQGVRAGAPPEVQKALAECTYDAFDRLVELATREQVAFALFAGDVYHESGNRLKAQLRFLEGLRKLDAAGIPSFVIHGNHDPLTQPPAEWPSTARALNADCPETVEVVREGQTIARITGQSYPRKSVPERLIDRYPMPRRDGVLEVAMLHGSLEGGGGEHKTYAPFTLADLQAKPYAYWALGHVHASRVLLNGPSVWAAYPGVLQGTNPRETGPKGAYLVEVDGDRVTAVNPREVAQIGFVSESLDVTGATTPEAVVARVTERIRQLATQAPKGTVLRLTLTGRTEAYAELTKETGSRDLLAELRSRGEALVPWVLVESLRLEVAPEIDLDAIRALGEIDRRRHLLVTAEDPPEDLMALIRRELGALAAKLPKGYPLPDEAELRARLLPAAREAIAQLGKEEK